MAQVQKVATGLKCCSAWQLQIEVPDRVKLEHLAHNPNNIKTTHIRKKQQDNT